MADTYDLVTLAEGKDAINVPAATTDYDAELATVITAASQRLVELCGPVVNRTFTNETYDGGDVDVELRNAAVGELAATTVSAAAEYDTAGTSTTLTAETYSSKPADGYVVDNQRGILYRRRSGYDAAFYPGRLNVVVTYTSGRAAATATVPARFKTAAAIMIAHLWRQRGPLAGAYRGDTDSGPIFGVAPFAVPRAVTELLTRDMRPAVG